jgi:hypothetical protein
MSPWSLDQFAEEEGLKSEMAMDSEASIVINYWTIS